MDDNKRDKILLAAQELFSERGYHETTVEEIAKLAGIAKGTVYIYFDSKEQLFKEVIKSGFKELTRIVEEKIETTNNPIEKIRLIVETYFNYFDMNRSLFRPLMMGEIEIKRRPSQQKRKKYIENYKRNLRRLSEIMEEAINMGYFKPADPWDLSLALAGIMEKFIFFGIEDGKSLKDLPDKAFDIFMKGALKEGVKI